MVGQVEESASSELQMGAPFSFRFIFQEKPVVRHGNIRTHLWSGGTYYVCIRLIQVEQSL